MPWSRASRNQAIVLIFVVVPVLMFGLGAGGFLIARAAGFGSNSIWVSLVMATVGFALSIYVTLRLGDQYETVVQKTT